MIKQPSGDFIELNFYFANIPEEEIIRSFVKTLIGLKAEFTGAGYVHRGNAIKAVPYSKITDPLLEEAPISSMGELEAILNDEDQRLIQVILKDATGTHSGSSEIVTFLDISPAAMALDRHPIAIWAEGYLLSGTFPDLYPTKAKKFGQRVYQRFIQLLNNLNPDYAAITIELGLECPHDLRLRPRSTSFVDFYVSRSFVGNDGLEKIQKEFTSAYQESVAGGIYFSGSKYLNPNGTDVPRNEAERKSILAAEVIARKALKRAVS